MHYITKFASTCSMVTFLFYNSHENLAFDVTVTTSFHFAPCLHSATSSHTFWVTFEFLIQPKVRHEKWIHYSKSISDRTSLF
jgi:hypothetical protein